MSNMTAFAEGCDARISDEETGELTTNPYTPGLEAFDDWYRGYNFQDPTRLASTQAET